MDPRNAPLRTHQPQYRYHFASTYADRGWSVIPVIGKRPALSSWKEFQSRHPSEQEIREWFASDDKSLNLGIVTGRISGLVVVDCDTADDATFWMATFPASPLVVKTGRGGSHIYYQFPDTPIGNRTRVLGRSIDIRGEGGLVVAPPSIHQESGNVYAWTAACDYALANVPQFDLNWVGAEEEVQAALVDPNEWLSKSSMPRSKRSMRRIQGLIRYLDEHESQPDRSSRDFACVMGLLRLGCSPSEVADLVRNHSKFRGNEGYLKVTMSNALKALSRE